MSRRGFYPPSLPASITPKINWRLAVTLSDSNRFPPGQAQFGSTNRIAH
jgi:hypothetical protein